MMIMLKLLSRAAVLGLLCAITIPVQADEIQDANKLFKQGQHAQAMEKINAFLAVKPKDAQARFLKGLILADQNNTPEAIAIFTKLTEDYPELPEPYNNLAVLYAGQGQYEKAKNSLEMAIRTHPNYPTAHENLGDIYAKMASQAYDRALQLDRSNTSAKVKLALIRELFSKNASAAAKPAATAQADSAPAPAPAASATPAVSQAAPAKPAIAATPVSADPVADVLKATQEWAAAWSAKNSNKYLAFYAKEFKVPGGNRTAWEKDRKSRIDAVKSIHVEIRDPKARVADDRHVSVSFKQAFRTTHLNRITSKTLEWVKANGQWLIAEETSEK